MRIFENENYDESILPISKFKLFCDIDAKYQPKEKNVVEQAIKEADEALTKEIPHLWAHLYPDFLKKGERAEYERLFFCRRDILKVLVWGEICSGSGKYMERILDIVWMIMEESSWFIPSHNRVAHDIGRNYNPLPVEYDNNFGYIDLFAAETAADLSIVCHFLGDRFDEDIRDIVNGKIVFSIKKRIIEPFVKYDDMFWMGFKGNTVGNWCPWITSNILLATALTEDNLRTRQLVVEKALKCLDNFIGGYDPDGGCSEGPMYWGHAGEALFDALEILYDMSGGIIDKFDTPIIGAICDYIRKVNICGNYYTCFADCHPEANPEIKAVYRMGKKTGNKLLCNFAKNEIKNGFGKYNERIFGLIRIIKDGVYPIDEKTDNYKPNYVECLPDLQVAVLRSERKPDAKFIIGIKGGHNGEQHNHIDVGNFVLYNNGKPFIIDLGICTYTKALFDDRRYTVFPVYGKAHNLPVINDKGEVEGIDYAATSFDADENLKAVKVSYKNAYENRDEIELCERTVKVSDKCVTVSEDVVLKENGNCLFNYYLYEKPEILNNNTAVFQNGLKINVTGGVLCAEDVELKDDRLIKDWKKDVLYKLVVKPENGKEFHVKIKAMKNN